MKFPWQKKKKRRVFISVIMPVYLGEYEGSASNREEKFRRALDSFKAQTFTHCNLIVVSDGCEKASKICKQYAADQNGQYKRIVLLEMDKQPLFSGNVRQKGLDYIRTDPEYLGHTRKFDHYVAYLDSDDWIGKNHLERLSFYCQPHRWAYYNERIYRGENLPLTEKIVSPQHGSIGTSSIIHKAKLKGVSWKGCDGYGHDWDFIQRLMRTQAPSLENKIKAGQYYICHIPNVLEA